MNRSLNAPMPFIDADGKPVSDSTSDQPQFPALNTLNSPPPEMEGDRPIDVAQTLRALCAGRGSEHWNADHPDCLPHDLGTLPARIGGEIQYSVAHPNDLFSSRCHYRLSFVPVIPTFVF